MKKLKIIIMIHCYLIGGFILAFFFALISCAVWSTKPLKKYFSKKESPYAGGGKEEIDKLMSLKKKDDDTILYDCEAV